MPPGLGTSTLALVPVPDPGRGEERLHQAEQIAPVGAWELDADSGMVTYSPGFARVLGLGADEPLSLENYEALIHPDDRAAFREALAACREGGLATCEHRVRAGGTERSIMMRAEAGPGGAGQRCELRGAVLDVSAQRQVERRHVAAVSMFEQGFDTAPIGMSLTDPRTGRYIRVNDALCALLGRSRADLMTLTLSDVTYPDDRGHDQQVRISLLEGTQPEAWEKRYVRPDGSIVWAEVHVAAVRGPDGGIEAFFAQKVDITETKEREKRLTHLVGDAEWLGRIRHALDEERLSLYSQPIVDLRTGETVQRELLLRIQDEDGSIISPGAFLPVAERYGLVREIDRWVIREAVRLAAADGLPTEFNLSAASLGDPEVLRELADAITDTGADPAGLIVEVTETAMIDRPEAVCAFVEQLRALGCGLAIDDFGTGFAGLASLKHLPAGHLKIDVDFVRDVAHSDTDARLVRGIVGLAREFDQTTIAEGIEDDETLVKLRELGVHRGQGYLFARPAPLRDDEPPRAAPRPGPSAADPLGTVRATFAAFNRRDLAAWLTLCHPEVVVRSAVTALRAGRDGVYRGHYGLAQYHSDVRAVWDELRLNPVRIWEVNSAVVALGRVAARRGGSSLTGEVVWVYRLREGLIVSIDVFHPTAPQLQASPKAVTAGSDPAP